MSPAKQFAHLLDTDVFRPVNALREKIVQCEKNFHIFICLNSDGQDSGIYRMF